MNPVDVDWTPGLVAVGVGLAIGAGLWARLRGGGTPLPTDAPAAATDLEARRRSLIQALHDLDENPGERDTLALSEERTRLERDAARVLRAQDVARVAERAAQEAAPTSPTPPPRGSEAQGMWKGIALATFVFGLAWALQAGTKAREPGMSLTGGPPMMGGSPNPGRPGGPVPNVPENLQPAPSAELDAARAAVAADPKSIPALVRLGWVLYDAQGWIDLYQVAQQTLALDPGQPDALVQSALVRMLMGQNDLALQMVDKALERDPKHLDGLHAKGILEFRRNNMAAALAAWQAGLDVGGPDHGFEELVQVAKGERPPPPTLLQSAPAHPGVGDTSAPPGAEMGSPVAQPPALASGGEAIEGTLTLAPGQTVPTGAVVFVMARPAGVETGPPVASLKLPAGTFPAPFRIGAENLMGGGQFPPQVTLMARLDGDGNAMTKGPTDLYASGGVVASGSKGIMLTFAPK